MANPTFHLSLGVHSLSAEIDFYESLLGAEVAHRDPSGYVNLVWAGCQITLKENLMDSFSLPGGFHFGANFTLKEFEALYERVSAKGNRFVYAPAAIKDEGLPTERKNCLLRSPSGYFVEIKGYQ